jgi:hypothetical protein
VNEANIRLSKDLAPAMKISKSRICPVESIDLLSHILDAYRGC